MNYPRIEKPTEPGWYWWRRVWADRKGDWTPVQAFRIRSFVVVDQRYIASEGVCVEWRGPIAFPEDPTE